MSLTVICVSPTSGNVTYSYMSMKHQRKCHLQLYEYHTSGNVTYSYMCITHQC